MFKSVFILVVICVCIDIDVTENRAELQRKGLDVYFIKQKKEETCWNIFGSQCTEVIHISSYY